MGQLSPEGGGGLDPNGIDPASRANLTARRMSALQWNAIGAGVRVVCQVGVTSLLALQLGPGPFGVGAAALVVIGLTNLFADVGIGAAILQADVVDDPESPSRFRWSWEPPRRSRSCSWPSRRARSSTSRACPACRG